jgi:hypothetical protein
LAYFFALLEVCGSVGVGSEHIEVFELLVYVSVSLAGGMVGS